MELKSWNWIVVVVVIVLFLLAVALGTAYWKKHKTVSLQNQIVYNQHVMESRRCWEPRRGYYAPNAGGTC